MHSFVSDPAIDFDAAIDNEKLMVEKSQIIK